ncbi:Nn.00g078830.m01.CDS01 [Neocucurbitaria sp. VM-36]
MSLSDWRHAVVDLTQDSDDDDEDGSLLPLPSAMVPRRVSVPMPTSTRASYTTTTTTPPNLNHVPLPGSAPRKPFIPTNPSIISKQTSNHKTISPQSSSRPSTAASSESLGRNGAVASRYTPMPGGTQNCSEGLGSAQREAKRMRVSAPKELVPSLRGLQHPSQAATKVFTTTRQAEDRHGPQRPGSINLQAQSNPERSRALDMGGTQGTLKEKIPSVQYMNSALKTSGATVPFSKDMPAGNARALAIGRVPEAVQMANQVVSESSTTQNSPKQPARKVSQEHENAHVHSQSEEQEAFPYARSSIIATIEGTIPIQLQKHPPRSPTSADTIAGQPYLPRPSYFSGTLSSPDDQNDIVMLDVSSKPKPDLQLPRERIASNNRSHHTPIFTPNLTSTAAPSKMNPGRPKYSNQFTKEQDHYLIFLKEVKLYPWKQITIEYNAEFPTRQYSTLQSRYATNLNKRDRSQDPAVLTLPSRFDAEATIDWQTVHANNPGPRARPELTSLHRDTVSAPYMATRPLPVRQTTDQDYSSGADSAPRRERSNRAKRVNYTWPKGHGSVGGTGVEAADEEEVLWDDLADVDDPTQSETPTEEAIPIPGTAVAVDNEPLHMSYDVDDAKLALNARKGPPGSTQNLPYLTSSQRASLQDTPADWDWDQLSSRCWQGSVLHVDFSPIELAVVEKAVAKIRKSYQRSRHTTRRRKMRALLEDLPEPKLLELIAEVKRRLPCRTRNSITAFVADARAGRIADASQIQRLTAARPQDNMSTMHKMSTYNVIRQRELGGHSRRGWPAAYRPVTYQIRNKYMDSFGPVCSWTGASSDVHTVAWSPDGECFAAGAVAVDDPDSMQYNRPNNLLYGNTIDRLIHELGEHARKREKTSTGANSTHAMFVSQDPKLYTTVSSVAFATSGRLMYSAGYDETVCAWHTNSAAEQPVLGTKIRFKAQIDMMTVNRNYDGMLATAAKITGNKAVRLLTLDEEDPSQFGKNSFYSSKAVSRSDLKILPTALQFEPTSGNLLLAGFGANVRDFGYDMTGDLCLWDVRTQAQLHIHGSNRNVFDVEFNPNRRYMPLFAVGCVAGGNVNRGTRSVLRLYDEKVDKFWCPLEIECKALDMNDVVWCPYDEYLIAAGCTDGRAYIWDVRWPTDPIRTLSHGRPLMPLQDGVPHELTDTGVRFLSWGENATRLYSGSSDGVVKVWDVTRSEENTFIRDLVTLDSGIMSGAFSPDKSKLVIGEVNGSVNVLEVGRDDCSIKDAEKMRFVPYDDEDPTQDSVTGEPLDTVEADSGIAEAKYLIQSGQVQLTPLGGLPVHQVVQGPTYAGPFDPSVDAPFLRQQALDFQLSMAAKTGPQCDITACKDSIVKVTNEETGDSGRSADRLPDELRRQWKAIESNIGIVPGKSKCTYCTRPTRPSTTTDPDAPILCERCSFACFRCGAANPIAASTTTIICDSCAGVWDIGALGYECIQQPYSVGTSSDVPSLKMFRREAYLERLEDMDTNFGDEMNALTDHYHSLAIDRPESPPL